MPVTDWKYPGSVSGTGWSASDAGTLVHAMSANDDVYAEHPSVDGDYLKCTNFSFALPSGSIPEGIEIYDESYVTNIIPPEPDGPTVGMGYQITKDNNVVVGTEKEHTVTPNIITNDGVITGGPTDLWGMSSLSEIDVEASTFGVWMRRGPSSTDVRGRLSDWLKMRVWYSEATANPTTTGANQRYLPGICERGGFKGFRRNG